MKKRKKNTNAGYHAAAMLLTMKYDEDQHVYAKVWYMKDGGCKTTYFDPDTLKEMTSREVWQSGRRQAFREAK